MAGVEMERESANDARDGAFGWRLDRVTIVEGAMAGLYVCRRHGHRGRICHCDLFQLLGEDIWARATWPDTGDCPDDDCAVVGHWSAAFGEVLCVDWLLRVGVLCARRDRHGDCLRGFVGEITSR